LEECIAVTLRVDNHIWRRGRLMAEGEMLFVSQMGKGDTP